MATYQLRLTARDMDTIRYVADHGYAMAVRDAWIKCPIDYVRDEGVHCPCCDGDGYADCECDRLIHVSEAHAWAIADEERDNGGHGFGPVNDELASKLYAFLHRIV